MLDEKVSVAPMLEWTDPHFRMLMRGITRKSVLYTEMLVDEFVVHAHPSSLNFSIGKGIEEGPSVIQLGGHDPLMLAEAAARCEAFCDGSYGEINLNCGCPSQRVAKRCFGAQLMLNPELVQQIVLAMQRRVQCGITIKCRIGIDDLDSYEDLRTFINTSCLQTGVRKVVLHARKAVSGLNTKQNRAVPPLHHSIAHQLAKDYPDIQFVLNGGVQALDEAAQHLQPDWLYRYDPSNPFNDVHWSVLGKRALENADSDQFIALPAVHGVMLGRSAYNNPLLLANADSQFYGLRDPCLSRRMILERYMDYCDFVQSDAGPEKVIPASSHAHGHGHAEDKVSKVTCAILLNAMRNVINQVKHVNKFRQELNDVYVSEVRRLGGKDVANPSARLVIDQAMQVLDQDELDAPLGNMDFYPDAVE